MEKEQEMRKVLDFYVRADALKTTISDKKNNSSSANSIFGSMILAVAFDSEFKETKDLSKVLRILFLDEFSRVNPGYNVENLKACEQYSNDLAEVRNVQTQEAKLASKYRILDNLLTNLIAEKEGILSEEELVNEARSIIASFGNTNQAKCDEIFRFYRLNYKLKNKPRTGWDDKHWNVKSDRIERVAEHIVGTIALFLAMQSEFRFDLDVNKVLKMLVIHETGETIMDDVTPFDGVPPEVKMELEHKAMKEALGNLTDKDELLAMLFEFDDRKTKEAKFAHFIDKIEADLKSKIYQEMGLHHSLDDQANNCVFKSAKVQQMLKDGAKTAFDIWYEWDKYIYADDEDYPEFIHLLNFAAANNILKIPGNTFRTQLTLNNN